eukprot:scaffold27006_cov254-Amphora_coffeaeformis.AAC.1
MPKYSSNTLPVALGTNPVALSYGDYTISIDTPDPFRRPPSPCCPLHPYLLPNPWPIFLATSGEPPPLQDFSGRANSVPIGWVATELSPLP